MKNIILCLVILAFAACSRKGAKVIKEEPVVLVPPVAEPIKEEAEEEQELPPAQIPPYLVTVIKKTECYGLCPVYEARLFSNGHLTYKGEKEVSMLGRYEAWADLDLIETIKKEAYRMGYFQLLSTYPANQRGISDIPKTITYLNFDNQEKTIINNYESPKQLRQFETYLEELFLQINWKKMNSGN